MQRAELRGRAMGGDLHVIVWARSSADRLAGLAARRVELLEQCWSRFRSDSELNLLHARAGHGPVPVSADLHRLVRALVDAWSWSEGDVDATVLGGMVAMGYDRDFASITAAPLPPSRERIPAQGMRAVRVHDGAVSLPRGVGLDPGAIGKGLAGDIVTAEIAGAGAAAVLMSLGGDVVTHGVPQDTGEWRISLRDDRTSRREEIDVITLACDQRAVATSSSLRRRWADRHHILDPRTGSPIDSDVAQASIVADCGWRAEAGATVALVRGSASAAWLAERGCAARLLEQSHA